MSAPHLSNDPSGPRTDWTWGEWVAYVERLQREVWRSDDPLQALSAYLSACVRFYDLFPPAECVMFPGPEE